MAKRRAEDILFADLPSKRCFRPLCGVDMQLESMAPAGDVSPSSLLALLGSRCRKRPFCCEEPEQQQTTQAALDRNTAHSDGSKKQTERTPTVQNSGSHSSATLTNSQKRFCTDSDTIKPKANDNVDVETTDTEDSIFNSFQYWRVPLPELDLSLLEDYSPPKDKSKLKSSFSDDMET